MPPVQFFPERHKWMSLLLGLSEWNEYDPVKNRLVCLWRHLMARDVPIGHWSQYFIKDTNSITRIMFPFTICVHFKFFFVSFYAEKNWKEKYIRKKREEEKNLNELARVLRKEVSIYLDLRSICTEFRIRKGVWPLKMSF